MAIPKNLHIIWIGDETKRPDAFIQTWRDMNPGFTLRVWGNDDLQSTGWLLGPQIKQWVPREINGAADVMRWEILYHHGGVALDADSACVRPLEDWLLEPGAFAIWENEIVRPGLIACGAMGFTPQHPLVGQIMADIAEDPDLITGMAWERVGPLRLTNTVRQHKFTDLTIYPSHYFIPRHFTGSEYQGTGPVFARQEWGSTHRSYGEIGQHAPTAAVSFQPAPAVAIVDPTPTLPPMINSYRRAQEAAVAISEGKPEVAQKLAADILRVEAEHPAARALLERAQMPTKEGPARKPLMRSAGGSFFLQKLNLGASVQDRLSLFSALVTGKKVLHVGCVDSPIFDPGNNLHLTLASQAGELHGLDIDESGLDELREHYDGVYFSSVEACLEAGTSYDVVLAPETIEHVPNAEQFLKGLDRVPFKAVVLTAPCIYGWGKQGVLSHRENDISYGPYAWLMNSGSFVEEVHPDHKYWFSPYTLANLVEVSTNWQIADVRLLQDGRQVCVIACKRNSMAKAA